MIAEKSQPPDVFQATVIGKIMFRALAWHSFCSTSDYSWLNSFLHCCIQLGYTSRHSAAIIDMFYDACSCNAFFRKMLYDETHVLYTYLPKCSETVYSLHSRKHSKCHIDKTGDLNDHHFLIRALYKDCYWL